MGILLGETKRINQKITISSSSFQSSKEMAQASGFKDIWKKSCLGKFPQEAEPELSFCVDSYQRGRKGFTELREGGTEVRMG